jgi:nucleolar complex protein 3
VCAADGDGVVVRLALLSLLAVFKDLLPGYRIRPVAEEEAGVSAQTIMSKYMLLLFVSF